MKDGTHLRRSPAKSLTCICIEIPRRVSGSFGNLFFRFVVQKTKEKRGDRECGSEQHEWKTLFSAGKRRRLSCASAAIHARFQEEKRHQSKDPGKNDYVAGSR